MKTNAQIIAELGTDKAKASHEIAILRALLNRALAHIPETGGLDRKGNFVPNMKDAATKLNAEIRATLNA